MNVLVIDTSVWIEYLRGKPVPALEVGLHEGRVYLPVVVVSELLSSFKPESKRSEFVEFLKELPLCDSSIEHWIRVGELRSRLSKKGIQISTPDAHIAQSAIDLDGYLLSDDKIFNRIAKNIGLRLAE